jgi:ankyrin repeat protein
MVDLGYSSRLQAADRSPYDHHRAPSVPTNSPIAGPPIRAPQVRAVLPHYPSAAAPQLDDAIAGLVGAIRRRELDTVRSLLAREPDLALGIRKDHPDRLPINVAAEVGDVAVVRLLIDHGALVRAPSGSTDWTLVPVARALLGLGRDLEESRRTGAASRAAEYMSVLRYLLDRGADPDARDGGWHPLLRAAQLTPFAGRAEVTRMLLDHGAHVTPDVLSTGASYAVGSANDDWLYAMPLAQLSAQWKSGLLGGLVRQGRYDLAEEMARIGGDVRMAYNERPLLGLLPSLDAEGRGRLVRFYRQHGGDMDAPMDLNGTTILMKALPDPELVEFLLDSGSNPNARDASGRTALLAALDPQYHRPTDATVEPSKWWDRPAWTSRPTRLANARLMLAHGADPNAMQGGSSALVFVYPNEPELADALFAAGGRVVLGSGDVVTRYLSPQVRRFVGALSWAVLKGNQSLAVKLYRRDGYSPDADCGVAFYAARFDNVELLDSVAQLGASLELRESGNHIGMFDAAIMEDSARTVAWMLEKGLASVDQREPVYLDLAPAEGGRSTGRLFAGGTTPLMKAARLGAVRTIDVLMAHGADVDTTDASGWTALDWAEGNLPALARLRAAGGQSRHH